MKKVIFITALMLSPALAFAHGDHAPRVATCAKECTQKEIETAAPLAVEMLGNAGKIESSWRAAKIEKVEKKDFKKGAEWVVTLFDEKKTEGKNRHYVFITTKGYLNGSNSTGE